MTRIITNTDHVTRNPWPDDVFVQGGDKGVVFRRGADAYRTAFVEAFPETSFLRGEGATIAEAEDACWKRYLAWRDCTDGTGRHGPYDRSSYTDGSALCTRCGIWFSRVLEPLPDQYRHLQGDTVLERALVDQDPAAVTEVLDTMAHADQLPPKAEGADS